MILTDIIEFYKCLKSLSGATAALNVKYKGTGKRKGAGRDNHSPKYSAGSKMFEKLLWESIRALVLSTRERKQTTVHSPNLRLPAASAQLHSLLRDPSSAQSTKREEKKNTGVESWNDEVRMWGWGPSLPQNWDLTLKRHQPPWSIFHRCLPAAGLSPHTPSPPPPLHRSLAL